MKDELYQDVMETETEEDYTDEKKYKKFSKRVQKSVGWFEPRTQGTVFAKKDKHGKLKPTSDVTNEETVWDINTGNGGGYTTDNKDMAILISYIVQMDKRLQRMEKKLMEK